ncbi:family 10 glycosylhydrolase [Botrimarina sp.]|uniref:glycoside hydrolase family 10 protein n=1 Tax=Botrimarina sp. TaxID=2795802 RepID=UPI0032EAF124
MFRTRLAALLVALILAVPAAAAAGEPTRGVWLASVGDPAMRSREGMAALVERCDRFGINTIYTVTWNRGVTLYPSELMRREFGVAIDPVLAGRDPLAELIELAHAKGIRVVAWFEFGFSSSYRQTDGGPLIRKRPGWAALDREGKLVSRNGFQWMNAIDPQVQDFLLAMLKEVVENYDVDGVQGDDRLPAMPSTGGYDPLTVELYRREHDGAAPPDDPRDPGWVQWRADKLSHFVERAYGELKALDPELCVSWAPSVWPWSRDNYLQDWPRWAREGWGDQFCPQVYRRELGAYRATLERVVTQTAGLENVEIVPGVLIALADGYDMPSERVREMVRVNRELGFRGEVFFYHGGLQEHAGVFRTLYSDPATD